MPAAQLDDAVSQYVRDILTAGPEAIAAAKALIPRVWNQPVANAMPMAAMVSMVPLATWTGVPKRSIAL